jgi:hypothetical protein
MQAPTQFQYGDYVIYTNTGGTAQNIGIVKGNVSDCYSDKTLLSVELIAKRDDTDLPFVRRGKLPIIVKPARLCKINANDYAYVLRPPLQINTNVWYHSEDGIKHYGHIVAEHITTPHDTRPGDLAFIVDVNTSKYPYHQDFRDPIHRFVCCYESELHEDFVIW